jgi:hypothetical protein
MHSRKPSRQRLNLGVAPLRKRKIKGLSRRAFSHNEREEIGTVDDMPTGEKRNLGHKEKKQK